MSFPYGTPMPGMVASTQATKPPHYAIPQMGVMLKEERRRSRDRRHRSSRSPRETTEEERDRSSERRAKRPISRSQCTRRSPNKENTSARTKKENNCKKEDESVRNRKQLERRRDDERNHTDEGLGKGEGRKRRSREREHSSAQSQLDVKEMEREKSRERQVERRRTDSWSRKRTPNRERFSGRANKETEKKKRDEEENYEKRMAQREIREEEKVYKDHLRIWEEREQRKLKEREKESARLEVEKREVDEKRKKLKTFLEDYDDERDDPEFYTGSAFMKKMEARKREVEEDYRDRQREKEELRKTLAQSGHLAPKPEIQSTLQEETHTSSPRVSEQPDPSQREKKWKVAMQPPPSNVTSTTKIRAPREIKGKDVSEHMTSQKPGTEITSAREMEVDVEISKQQPAADVFATHSSADASVSDTNCNSEVVLKRKMSAANTHEADNYDDEKLRRKKRRKLEHLADIEQQSKPVAAPVSQITRKERIKLLKDLTNKIPIVKEDIFIYNLEWNLVDNTLIENRIQPWINKKIAEYAGQEVPILVEYLCLKVRDRSDPQSILDDLTNILDDEAEFFVVSLWRLLIYETEATKVGSAAQVERVGKR